MKSTTRPPQLQQVIIRLRFHHSWTQSTGAHPTETVVFVTSAVVPIVYHPQSAKSPKKMLATCLSRTLFNFKEVAGIAGCFSPKDSAMLCLSDAQNKRKDLYHMPKIDEALDILHGA